MRELFIDGVQTTRMNYYPPCPEPDKAIGLTPHSDTDALTIIVRNGIYQSMKHRATVNSTNERFPIATFHSSNLDSELGPAPSLIGPDNPANF
ncbi:codeine O-demethylase-like [Castanea sativa]|uniref:codeine O-demethylase-like n=1 Tax=Castanea sativa TaxID=21020 RepID=UPI003F6501CC